MEKLEVPFSHARTTRKKQKHRAPSSLPTRFTRTRRAIVSVGTPVCNLSTLLPAGTSIIGFADDALVVCAADDIGILELRINESLRWAKRWLDRRGLKMAPEKTEAFLVTDRRSFQYPRIVLGKHEVEWRTSIKYLGVQLNRRLSFGEHLRITTAKAIQCGASLARLMPNIGGTREVKRRLVASVVHSRLLYAAPVWAKAL